MDNEANEQQQGNESGKEFREKFERALAENKELRPLREENILLRMKLDPDAGQVKLFRDAYNARGGEWTMDAVKAAMEEYGIQPQQDEQRQEQQRQQEQQLSGEADALARMAGAAGSGKQPSNKPDYTTAKSPEEVIAMYLQNGGQVIME